MATQKQREANRLNAQKSTGPKSEEGKSVARMNAYTHGLTAQTIVIGDEDPKAFDALRAQLEAEFNPRPGLEADLVERLAVNIWRMRRMPVFEAAIIRLGSEQAASNKRQGHNLDSLFDPDLEEVPFEDIALGLIRNQGMLRNLSRYETSLLNAYNRTLQQLIALQERRESKEAEAKVVDLVAF